MFPNRSSWAAPRKPIEILPPWQPVLEGRRYRNDGQRRVAQLAVADGERQHVGPGADRPRLVDEGDVWCMGETGQVAGLRGRPDPHEQTSSLLNARAAVTTIISDGVGSLLMGHHMLLQPSHEAISVTGDGVPLQVKGVVPLVVAMGVGGSSAARHHRYRVDRPGGQHSAVGAGGSEVLD